MTILKTRRGQAVLGALIGLLTITGVAVAAILLTTTISGAAKVKTIVGTANDLKVAASSANGSALDCSGITLSSDLKTLAFNPVLTITTNGANSNATPVDGGACTIKLDITNTGTKSIKVDPTQTAVTVPPVGWSITGFTGDATSPIAAGQTRSISATLTAKNNAVDGGTFGGKLVFTDA